jgi:hypothetical protein
MKLAAGYWSLVTGHWQLVGTVADPTRFSMLDA